MSTKTKTNNNPYGIKTPTSVEEFRENLKKYYVVNSFKYLKSSQTQKKSFRKKYTSVEDTPITDLDLLVRYGEVDCKYIPLTDISSFNDLWLEDKDEPKITPMVHLVKDEMEYMMETGQNISFHDYFNDEKNFKLYDKQISFLTDGTPSWYSLSNQKVREFYMMTLGDYCGYKYLEEERV